MKPAPTDRLCFGVVSGRAPYWEYKQRDLRGIARPGHGVFALLGFMAGGLLFGVICVSAPVLVRFLWQSKKVESVSQFCWVARNEKHKINFAWP